jgi:hypothetical protein
MPSWIGRKGVSALLLAGAIAIAGCGGSKSTSSAAANSGSSGSSGSSGNSGTAALKTYFDAVPKAIAPYTAAAKATQANPTDAASWDQSSQTAKQAADKISALTAPAGLESQQQALVASLTQVSNAAAKVATDLKNKDTSTRSADLPRLRPPLWRISKPARHGPRRGQRRQRPQSAQPEAAATAGIAGIAKRSGLSGKPRTATRPKPPPARVRRGSPAAR